MRGKYAEVWQKFKELDWKEELENTLSQFDFKILSITNAPHLLFIDVVDKNHDDMLRIDYRFNDDWLDVEIYAQKPGYINELDEISIKHTEQIQNWIEKNPKTRLFQVTTGLKTRRKLYW